MPSSNNSTVQVQVQVYLHPDTLQPPSETITLTANGLC